MESEDNKVPKVKDSDKEMRDWTVIQDFNNKKANSHATIFVASMFALFTVLSLAQRIMSKGSQVSLNYVVLPLFLATYILIWFFGLYSMLNFSFYSTISQRAEERIIGNRENDLIKSTKVQWKGILKLFSNYKVPDHNESQGRASSTVDSNFGLFIGVYIAIGLLPLVAFIIWFFFV
jgi:hypothetical protein